MTWIVQLVLIAAAIVAGWFVANDTPNFGVIQAMTALVLIVLALGVLALSSGAWKRARHRLKNPD